MQISAGSYLNYSNGQGMNQIAGMLMNKNHMIRKQSTICYINWKKANKQTGRLCRDSVLIKKQTWTRYWNQNFNYAGYFQSKLAAYAFTKPI